MTQDTPPRAETAAQEDRTNTRKIATGIATGRLSTGWDKVELNLDGDRQKASNIKRNQTTWDKSEQLKPD